MSRDEDSAEAKQHRDGAGGTTSAAQRTAGHRARPQRCPRRGAGPLLAGGEAVTAATDGRKGKGAGDDAHRPTPGDERALRAAGLRCGAAAPPSAWREPRARDGRPGWRPTWPGAAQRPLPTPIAVGAIARTDRRRQAPSPALQSDCEAGAPRRAGARRAAPALRAARSSGAPRHETRGYVCASHACWQLRAGGRSEQPEGLREVSAARQPEGAQHAAHGSAAFSRRAASALTGRLARGRGLSAAPPSPCGAAAGTQDGL